MRKFFPIMVALTATCTMVVSGTGVAFAAGNPLQPGAEIYLDPNSTTMKAAATLTGQDQANALLLAQYPTATWFDGGTPAEVQSQAHALVTAADAAGQVPVIVAYNLPNRDCGNYSAGGAANLADYEAWITGLATGIGNLPAVVILEPDGVGIVPNYSAPGDSSNCTIADPNGIYPQARWDALNFAVMALKAGTSTAVYLDGTHAGWENIGNNASRLIQAGVLNADGFFLNVSAYQYTSNSIIYGTWVSDCIALTEAKSPSDPLWAGASTAGSANCPNQYWNGGASTGYAGVALDPNQEWNVDPWPGVSGVAPAANNGYFIQTSYTNALAAAGVTATTHFVIDTSRNGQGPWHSTDSENWCNPPGMGVGLAPTTDTGNPLVDAFLWVKVPGESDGQCQHGSGDGTDPQWGGITDPAAGAWFPQQAAQLIELANPPLTKQVPTTTLTYDANVPTGVKALPQNMPADETGLLVGSTFQIAADAPSLDGFAFSGWCTKQTAKCSAADLYQPGSTLTITPDITLYARWTITIDTGGSVAATVPWAVVGVVLLAGGALLVTKRRALLA